MNKPERKTKKDFGLVIAIIIAAGVLAAALLPVISSGVLSGNYQEFVKRYTDSMNLSRKSGKLTVIEGAEEIRLSADAASRVYTLLLDAGMGKPQNRIPEEAPLEICFADDSRIQFWQTAITEKSAKRETGLLVRYQAADEYEYMYDTDELTMDAVMDKIK